jgi:hypothetical protein
VRAGNVISAASRRRVAVTAIYPGASIYPSETMPDVTNARSAIVYWYEVEIPGGASDRRAVVYWYEVRIPG